MPTAADAGAGYSGTPLTRKLGVSPGHRVLLLGAPHDFDLPDLPDGATVRRRAGTGRFDVVLAFCPDRRALERRFDAARAVVPADGAVWLAWPKRSSGVVTSTPRSARSTAPGRRCGSSGGAATADRPPTVPRRRSRGGRPARGARAATA